MHRHDIHFDLRRQPAAKIDHHDSITLENPQQRALQRLQTEFDRSPGYRHSPQRANVAHSEPDMAVVQPDFGKLHADPRRHALPDHGGFRFERVTCPAQPDIPNPVVAGHRTVDMAFCQLEIHDQVEAIPTRERRKQY